MTRSRLVRAAILAMLLFGGSSPVWAQEGILRFTAEPAVLDVASGGKAATRLTMRNSSPYEADEVEIAWLGDPSFSLDPSPEVIAVVDAFASRTVEVAIGALTGTPLGETRGSLEILYSYCIGDLCYQIVESVPVTLRIVASAAMSDDRVLPVDREELEPASMSWRWMAFGVMVLLAISALFARRSGRWRATLVALLAAAAVGGLAIGVSLDQHSQAQAVGAVLCTSCVGIETVQREAPRLSPAQAAAVDLVTARVELLVFYATWCRSCPYAEALADLVAARNPRIAVRHIDAETERELAALHGVTRSGRTVVPAIVRVDTGEVLFGVEDLGERLVDLLEEGT